MDEEQVVETGEVDEAVEREARDMGWNPDHKGTNFISAKDFVDRGKNILPIVQATNQRLRGELAAVSAQATANEGKLRALEAGQAALEEARDADLAEARKQERAAVKAELARASEAGDHAAVAEATDDLTRLNTEDAEAKRLAAAKIAAGGNGSDTAAAVDRGSNRPAPEVMTWLKANPDFARDPEKIALGNVMAAKLRVEQPDLKGSAFLDEVANRVEKRLGNGLTNKVEGGGATGGRGGSGSGKSYADLPADAKAVCDRQAAKFVGPNRAHKDNASWQRSYAIQYFNQR